MTNIDRSSVFRRNILLVAASIIVVVGALFAALLWSFQREPTLGGDFSLIYRDQPWTFSAHAKDLNILYIGYAKCPDVCPLSLNNTAQAIQSLAPDDQKHVQVIFLSVDAAHDNTKDVADYAAQFHPDFIGLTGQKADIDKTVALFGASYLIEDSPGSYLGYSIIHTDRLFFLDNDGHVRDSLANPRSPEEILNKIKENL